MAYMTVRQLREMLAWHDQDAEVLVAVCSRKDTGKPITHPVTAFAASKGRVVLAPYICGTVRWVDPTKDEISERG